MELTIRTEHPETCTDITKHVQEAVSESGIEDGLVHVYAKHATAAIIINENHDPKLPQDLLDALEETFPKDGEYRHDRIDDNAHAHLKAAVLGPQETIPVRDGELALGTWQAVMLVELDGPRTRHLEVTALAR